MENKKGSGIFLGIVSIATLIVAIIGATFAYFSASTESNDGAIGVQAYEYQLSLHVESVYAGVGTALIPLNPNTVIENAPEPNNKNLLYAINVAKNKCVDDSGMQVCALYRVVIQNDATNDVIMSGELQTTSNIASTKPGRTPFTNLTYQQIKGDHNTDSLELVGDPITIKSAVGESIKIADITVPGGKTDELGDFKPGVGYSYILIYLNDNENQTGEMGASFMGKLIYSSAGSDGNALTGTFRISGTQEPEDPDTGGDEPTGDETDDPTEPTE